MQVTTYRALKDLEGIVTNAIPEGVALEYKASDIIARKSIEKLCKTIAAFANSAGGQFVVGVEAANGVPVRLDGGVPGPSQRDWIYQIVSSRTSPPIESFEVFEIPNGGNRYYVIDVSVSSLAPHQFDHKYYKRRGPRSEPMEHYEIEDVRSRPKGGLAPLRVEIGTAHDVILLLTLRNDHASVALANLKFSITHNFDTDAKGFETLTTRGLRSIRPTAELSFHLGSAIEVLKVPDAELTVVAEYDFLGKRMKETFQLFLGDLKHTAIVRPPEVEVMKSLTEKVDQLVRETQRSHREYEQLLQQMIDGTGVRLSHSTVAALQGKATLLDPEDFTWTAYRTLLDISSEDARRLRNIFRPRFGGNGDERERYEKLPADLRGRFEEVFKVRFE